MARAALLERLIAPVALTWRAATVREVKPETSRASTLVLDVPEWRPHRAGQHLDIRLTAEDGYVAERSYSIASAPEDGSVQLTVERVADGEVSPYLLDAVLPGDQLEVRGPIGRPFTWAVDDGGPLLLAGGGSGFVPLMAMLRHRAAQGSEVQATALISVRSPGDLLYADELEQLMGPGLDARVTYTREPPADWRGFGGRVSADMLRQLGPGPEANPRAFICGPTGFVETVADLLVAAGHDPQRIHTERFGPTG